MSEFLTTVEVARLTGYTVEGIRYIIARGQIPAKRVGKMWLIPVAAISKMLDMPEDEIRRLVWQRKSFKKYIERQPYYSVRQVAKACGISAQTLYSYIKKGKLEAETINGQLFIPAKEIGKLGVELEGENNGQGNHQEAEG